MTSYIVTWKRKPYALPFLIDFTDETSAIKCAVALNETGRYDVTLTSTEYEQVPIDPELNAKIRARVFAAANENLPVFA